MTSIMKATLSSSPAIHILHFQPGPAPSNLNIGVLQFLYSIKVLLLLFYVM